MTSRLTAIDLAKLFKDVGQGVCMDANSRIAHDNFYAVGRGTGSDSYLALVRELYGVAGEIEDDLAQPLAIASD